MIVGGCVNSNSLPSQHALVLHPGFFQFWLFKGSLDISLLTCSLGVNTELEDRPAHTLLLPLSLQRPSNACEDTDDLNH